MKCGHPQGGAWPPVAVLGWQVLSIHINNYGSEKLLSGLINLNIHMNRANIYRAIKKYNDHCEGRG